jgi:hypothetical protein
MSKFGAVSVSCCLLLVETFASTSGGAQVLRVSQRGSPASMTFVALGRPDGVVFNADAQSWSASPRMWFDLPANTREQRSNWYVLHLHYRVVLAQPFVLGRETIIGAATNKVGCAYIRFKPLSQSTIDVAEDGTLHGVTHRKVEATTVTGWFENYLAAAGVHGGRNSLDLIVSQHTGTVLLNVKFYGDSFIAHTSHGPSVLRLRGVPKSIALQNGETAKLEIKVRNAGGTTEPAVRVRLSALAPRAPIQIRPSATLNIGPIRPGGIHTVTFRVRALRVGSAELSILAGGPTASTGSVVKVTVQR